MCYASDSLFYTHGRLNMPIVSARTTRTRVNGGASASLRAQKRLQATNGLTLTAQKDLACLILRMPNEIVLAINAHLEVPWQTSCALICKHLKEVMCPKDTILCLKVRNLAISLSAWVRNVPDRFFCFCCNKVRPWSPGLGWDGQDHGGTIGPFRNLCWKSTQPLDACCRCDRRHRA